MKRAAKRHKEHHLQADSEAEIVVESLWPEQTLEGGFSSHLCAQVTQDRAQTGTQSLELNHNGKKEVGAMIHLDVTVNAVENGGAVRLRAENLRSAEP